MTVDCLSKSFVTSLRFKVMLQEMKFFAALFSILLMGAAFSGLGQEAILQGTIRDAVTGQPCACTVAITDPTGKLVTETESFKGGFRCEGQFRKRLPAGHIRIRITRGFETRWMQEELELEPGTTKSVEFRLERVCDLRKRGWYGGDSHVHMLHGERTVPVSFDFIAVTARSEDLQYVSVAQAWDIKEATPEALEAELRSRSKPDCWLTWNMEAPKNYYKGDAGRCLGHCWNLGIRGRTAQGSNVISVLQAASAWDYESAKPTYANFESHSLIHEQGGAVFYTHPARWWIGSWGGKGGYPKIDNMRVSNMAVELPLDTILGPTFDGIDVITGPGEAEANEKAFTIWAMLLNHGYHLAATGSSDACFDRPGGAAPGIPRTYTFVPDGFSMEKVTQATASGRTFVSTGPLLVATVDGEPPGSEFPLEQKERNLSIEGWASGASDGGLERLEILRNGEPFRKFEFSDNPATIRTNVTFLETNRSWYCVRLWGSSKKQQAISSAFYFGGKEAPPAAKTSVQVNILDARTGQLLNGTVTEVQFSGTLARDLKQHALPGGEGTVNVPGTVRLRAESAGYVALILSPVLDNEKLIQRITSLGDADLLEWKTFEGLREELSRVELVFRLERQGR